MTTILWTGKTWNPTVGCSRDNEECDHCFAMFVAHRGMDQSHRGLTKLRPKGSSRPGVDWNGTVRTLPDRLGKPLTWKKAQMVFVNSMSDLFHPSVPFEFVAAVFGVMSATPRHTYQVLTKRPKRAREFFAWLEQEAAKHDSFAKGLGPLGMVIADAMAKHGMAWPTHPFPKWPLPNVHIGVSAGRQETAEEKILPLLDCPAAVHWVSIEPMLGPVDLEHLKVDGGDLDALRGLVAVDEEKGYVTPNRLRWIVVGGESGPGARTCDLAWIRSVLSQCAAAGVPAFSKQVGSNPVVTDGDGTKRFPIRDAKGEDWRAWPDDLKVRLWPA